MDETRVVTCFLRNRGEILLVRRSDAVGSYRGRWGAISGHLEGDPEETARQEISQETGLNEAVTLNRRGEPFEVVDADRGTRWIVHPFLFESESRAVESNWESSEFEWVPPTEIHRRESVPDLWESYDRVRPTVETIEADRDHGSAWLSIRALEVLRDAAGRQTWAESDGGWASVAATARALRDARSMPVVANRINRVMASAGETPAAVESRARAAIESARETDNEAARVAGERLPDRLATLSRSGTVRAAIERATPESVLVAESRPGGEGVAVAESLAEQTAVTLSSDAGFPWAIAEFDAEAVVVGADAILPDGSVSNKVGTRSAALAAAHEGIDCLVVAAVDKIAGVAALDGEKVESDVIYDGSADIAVTAPLFDVTPSSLVTAICTDRGVLQPGEIESIATEHRENARWDEEEPPERE